MKVSSLSKWHYLGFALSLIVVGAALVALHRILGEVRLSEVLARFAETPTTAVLLALACTAASYVTLTGYDATALRQIERPLPYRQAALASFISFAFSHNIGLAALTGGSLRYRIYSTFGLSGVEVALLTAICGVTYGLGLAFLLGFALLLEPARLARTDTLPIAVNQGVGVALLLAVAVYALWTGLRTRPFSFKDWRIPSPNWGMTLSQICIGAADVSFAAAALYIVLPSGVDIGFAAFVGIYVAAMTVGALSHLPGAIGVFEAVMLLALPTAEKGALLGALLVYRCIYYFLPFGVAALLLVWQELRRRQADLGPTARAARDIARAALPQVIGAAAFAGGAILLVSAATPAIESRMALLRDLLPLPFVEASHFLSSLVGLFLLILAHGLVRRLERAYLLTAVLLAAGMVFSLLKGLDYKEALLLGAVLLLLLASRHAFHRRAAFSILSFSPSWLVGIAAVVAAFLWLGLFAYKEVGYSDELWWIFAFQGDASRFLRASVLVAVLGLAFVLFAALRPAPPDEKPRELGSNDR